VLQNEWTICRRAYSILPAIHHHQPATQQSEKGNIMSNVPTGSDNGGGSQTQLRDQPAADGKKKGSVKIYDRPDKAAISPAIIVAIAVAVLMLAIFLYYRFYAHRP